MNSLHYMRSVCATATWFLTGLFVALCLIGSLPAMQSDLLCAKERTVEIDLEDDDKDFIEKLEFSSLHFTGFRHAENWQAQCLGTAALSSAIVFDSHLVRGPPNS